MKRIPWLAAGAVLAAGLWYGLGSQAPHPPVETIAAMPILALNPQRVDRIEILHGATRIELERRGQTWCLAQNGGYPVRPELARRLQDQLLALVLTHPTTPATQTTRTDDPKDARAGLTSIRAFALDGAGLGALIVADHAPTATQFSAHQLGDPRDWQAEGTLATPTALLDWIDPHILTVDPARATAATIQTTAGSFTLDAPAAAERLKTLEGYSLTEIHPAAQIRQTQTGRTVFTLDGGASLTVDVYGEGDQLWLAFTASGPGITAIPPGAWLFHYPPGAASLLQAPT